MVTSINASGPPQAHSGDQYRMQFKFWLNIVKDDEMEIASIINAWKRTRKFTEKLRRALMLYITLEQDKDLTLLDEWFPFVRAENRELLSRIERLEAAVMQTAAVPAGQRFALPGMEGLERLSESIFSNEPIDSSETRKNFASGMGDLFADDDDLWD